MAFLKRCNLTKVEWALLAAFLATLLVAALLTMLQCQASSPYVYAEGDAPPWVPWDEGELGAGVPMGATMTHSGSAP